MLKVKTAHIVNEQKGEEGREQQAAEDLYQDQHVVDCMLAKILFKCSFAFC
jgi:hypothetical protein